MFVIIHNDLCAVRAPLLLASTDIGDSGSALSTGIYIVRANATDLADERNFVIYWPEDTTWYDSAASSVCRNRVTFMRSVVSTHPFSSPFMVQNRSLAKICDQNVALLSPEYSTSILWNDEESDAESVDMATGEFDRVFTFEVAETNEQEENAFLHSGFQVPFIFILYKSAADLSKMDIRHPLPYACPPGYQVDPAALTPRLLHGETTQGFLTASYVPPQTRSHVFNELAFSRISLRQLL
jgi:hypothetical protein